MASLQSVLSQEIRRLARREIRAEVETTKKAVAQHRREIAELKRRIKALEGTVDYLELREAKRLKAEPSQAEEVPEGTRFSHCTDVPGQLSLPQPRRAIPAGLGARSPSASG